MVEFLPLSILREKFSEGELRELAKNEWRKLDFAIAERKWLASDKAKAAEAHRAKWGNLASPEAGR